MKYYCEDAAEVLRQVESSEQGLTGAEAAKRLELVIPKDISVISFDNHSWKGAEANGLTTFDEPLRAQGEAAVELLRSWVATGKRPESLEFKPELVERSSIREIIG